MEAKKVKNMADEQPKTEELETDEDKMYSTQMEHEASAKAKEKESAQAKEIEKIKKEEKAEADRQARDRKIAEIKAGIKQGISAAGKKGMEIGAASAKKGQELAGKAVDYYKKSQEQAKGRKQPRTAQPRRDGLSFGTGAQHIGGSFGLMPSQPSRQQRQMKVRPFNAISTFMGGSTKAKGNKKRSKMDFHPLALFGAKKAKGQFGVGIGFFKTTAKKRRKAKRKRRG
jgi:hypothetical protein